MKKIFLILIFLSSFMFSNTALPEWTKKIKQPKDCKISILDKIKEIDIIGKNINESPAIWLSGKVLNFVNSQCSITYDFITSKELLIKRADLYFEDKNDWFVNVQEKWFKDVTQPEHCIDTKNSKTRDILTISSNVLKEHPAIWLQGKYLEFVNSQCSLNRYYSLRGTSKEDFEKIVDDYFESLKPKQNEELKYNDHRLSLWTLIGLSILILLYFALIRRFLWKY